MNDLTLFGNGEFELQVIPEGDTFIVSAPGVARSLGFRDAARLVETIPAAEKGYTTACTPGDLRTWHLTEAGFYRAIGQRQPARIKDVNVRAQVERFQAWVFGEVLPAIRKNGSYGTPKPSLSTPAEMLALAEAYVTTARELVAKDARLAIVEPMAAQAEFHRSADGLVPVGDFANKLKAWAKENHGVKVLHQEVWDFLADIRIVIRGDKIRNNQPTAFATDKGFVKVKETEYVDSEGFAHISISTRLTPAGEGWAWDRAIRRIAEHGSLRPSMDLERKAS